MEKNIVKKRHLKRRILIQIMVILTFSMTVSTIISFVYFNRIVRNQSISNEQTKMFQLSLQMEYMLEDIENYARSIVVDENLQAKLKTREPDTEFERVKKRDVISRRLAFYNGLRLFIAGSFLVEAEGESYSSVFSSQSVDYLGKKLATEQIIEYMEHPEWIFSNPYYGIDTWEGRQLVCFRTNLFDIYNYSKLQGILYLEINLNYFLEHIENYGEECDNVCLIGNEGNILYEKQESNRIEPLLEGNPDCLEEGYHKVKNGYLLCEDINGTGWKLCTVITNNYLWQQSKYVLEFFFLSFTLSILLILVTISRQMEMITRPVELLSRQMEQTSVEKLTFQEPFRTGDEIQTLYECYNEMVKEIQNGIDRKIEYEKQKQDMEFDIMLSQINPHYLYNVLNTVVYLSAAGKNKEVGKIVNSLIFSLQETLRLGDGNLETSIQKELELTQCYLNIQQCRYPDTFHVETMCDEALLRYLVPKTMIQPLVENALLHGILPMEKKGKIRIEIKEKQGKLWITVIDNGIGVSNDVISALQEKKDIRYENNGRKHIGISNVRDRIQYLYGDPYGIWIRQGAKAGTEVVICLPVKIGNMEDSIEFKQKL